MIWGNVEKKYTEIGVCNLRNPLEFFKGYGKVVRTNSNLRRTQKKKTTKDGTEMKKFTGMTSCVLTREIKYTYLIGLVILFKILRT